MLGCLRRPEGVFKLEAGEATWFREGRVFVDKSLGQRAWKAVAYPPLSDLSAPLRREFQEALLEAHSFRELPGKWQAALLESEANAPKLRPVNGSN